MSNELTTCEWCLQEIDLQTCDKHCKDCNSNPLNEVTNNE
jgi:hypothetical protein